jgi:hypothetical protein
MMHQELIDSAASYALDALDSGARVAAHVGVTWIERHLRFAQEDLQVLELGG